jgi:hypothetical protein
MLDPYDEWADSIICSEDFGKCTRKDEESRCLLHKDKSKCWHLFKSLQVMKGNRFRNISFLLAGRFFPYPLYGGKKLSKEGGIDGKRSKKITQS